MSYNYQDHPGESQSEWLGKKPKKLESKYLEMDDSGFHIYKLESLNKKLISHNKRVDKLKEQGYEEDFTDIRDVNKYGKMYVRTRLIKGEEHDWVETIIQKSRK